MDITKTKSWILVYNYFESLNVTAFWFNTKNPMLGNITPKEMIENGREKKLEKFIKNNINENEIT